MGLFEKANSTEQAKKAKAKLIIKNEQGVLETIRGLCTDDRVDNSAEIRYLKNYPSSKFTFYKLENGVRVIKENNSEWMLVFMGDLYQGEPEGAIISTGRVWSSDEKVVTYSYFDPTIEDGGIAFARFSEEGKHCEVVGGITTKRDRHQLKIKGEASARPELMEGTTIIELIEESLDGQECDGAREVVEVMKNDFKKILSLVPEREIVQESESQIALRTAVTKIAKLTGENKELRGENAKLTEDNGRLREENDALTSKNKELSDENEMTKKRYSELMEKLKRIRDFVVHRCGKIPFVGKKIVAEMNEELKTKELPDGR